MALYIEKNNSKDITLNEFIHYLDHNIDFSDPESICSAGPIMQGLCNNLNWFSKIIDQDLKDSYKNSSKVNGYGSNVLWFTSNKKYSLRAVNWIPSSSKKISNESKHARYAENCLHNHNFNLLTVGLFGPGYTTKMYKHDLRSTQVGDEFLLEESGVYKLKRGSCLFMKEDEDIHTQLLPESLSVSFNLMVQTKDTPQFLYKINEEKSTLVIDQVLKNHNIPLEVKNKLKLIDFASCFINDNLRDTLNEIYKSEENVVVKNAINKVI